MRIRRHPAAAGAPSGPGAVRRILHPLRAATAGSPSRFAVLVFTGIIFLWTALLMLPISAADGAPTPFHAALFTAVSTICVTGLSIVDMGTHWSLFGNVVIFIGLEVGAIGVLTLASIMGAIVTRRLGLRQRLMAASDQNAMRIHAGPVAESQAIRLGDIGGMLVTVAVSLLVVEVLMALVIIPRFLLAGYGFWESIADGFYLAASAFTNTGFTPNAEGLAPFAGDVWLLGALAVAVFLGSLGFPVIFAIARQAGTLPGRLTSRRDRVHRGPARVSVHVRLTLATTVLLFGLGTVALYLLEMDNPGTFGRFETWAQPLHAAFLSVMARSGGFAVIDVSQVEPATMLALDALMFIGGGSASTAGGIKVTTFAILLLAAVAEAKGVQDIQAFGRRIPTDVLRLAVAIAIWGATIVVVSSILLMHLTGAPFSLALFDSISAFATCGLSTGLTAQLPPEGTYVLSATMWLGRVGTVTMAAALASSERKQLFRLPEERVIVG